MIIQEVGAGPIVGEDQAVVEDLVVKGERKAGINLVIKTDLEAEVDLEVEVGEDLTDHLVEINHRAQNIQMLEMNLFIISFLSNFYRY